MAASTRISNMYQITTLQGITPNIVKGFNQHSWPALMADVIITVLFVLFSVGFLSMCIHYIRTRIGQTTLTIEVEAPQPPVAKGMDSEAINALPIFKYSDVKDGMIGRGVAQCAVCLSDFEDGDPVRVLPECYHVFHSHCVDEWLASHATCPVCRTNLISV